MTQATKPKTVEVTVSYLPATHPFHKAYPPETTLESVRIEAMAHFGVENHTDRDVHEFFLEREGERITDYTLTIAAFLGEHRKGLHLGLVEQVTAGAL